MSLCVMSERSVRKLGRQVNMELVHAAINHNGRSVLATDSSLRCWWIDRPTGEVEPAELGSFAWRARTVIWALVLGAPQLVGCPPSSANQPTNWRLPGRLSGEP